MSYIATLNYKQVIKYKTRKLRLLSSIFCFEFWLKPVYLYEEDGFKTFKINDIFKNLLSWFDIKYGSV